MSFRIQNNFFSYPSMGCCPGPYPMGYMFSPAAYDLGHSLTNRLLGVQETPRPFMFAPVEPYWTDGYPRVLSPYVNSPRASFYGDCGGFGMPIMYGGYGFGVSKKDFYAMSAVDGFARGYY